MVVTAFTSAHICEAGALARVGYEEERRRVPALPPAGDGLDLTDFAANGLGAAAFEGNRMVGFLCGTPPFEQAFGTTEVRGVFSPMGAHAAAGENREKILACLYAFAAEKWVRAGALSHGVCLYAHDEAAQRQFFRYGFGLRCVDSLRSMEPVECARCESYVFSELEPDEFALAYPLETGLRRHFLESPCFMNREPVSCDAFCESCARAGDRLFAASFGGTLCAVLKISASGENFLSENAKYRHITSAFCQREHRGGRVMQNLLNFAIERLKNEGYTRLGVDYESFNPAGSGFWTKYFAAYTHGVVRRVDERIRTAETYAAD